MSMDPLVETASTRLDIVLAKAEAIVKRWFPNMADMERRITMLAVMKQIVALMQLEAGVPTPSAPVPQIPQLDIGEINDLLWTTYKTKERAQPGQAAWTFSDPARHDRGEDKRVVEELAKAMRTSPNGKLQLGDMEYSFSGAEKQFISRRPARKK